MGMMQQMFAGFPTTAGAPGVTTDALFKYVSLLLNGDSGTAFNADASTNNLLVNISGTSRNDTFSPFRTDGNYSNYFNGTTDRLSIASNAAFAFGTGDYTVECWINPASLSAANGRIIDRGDTVGNLIAETGSIVYYYSASKLTIPSGQATVGIWSHIAVVRSGTTLSIYFNGVLKDSITNSTNLGATTVTIGSYSTGIQLFNGSISNLRMVKGTAVYTSNFTPPTSPLTAITNTSLLTCQSARFKDNSTNNLTITPAGTPAVKPAIPFTYTDTFGSAYFNGTTADYVQTPNTSVFNISGSGDFTIEAWVYNTGAGSYRGIFGARSTGQSGGWCMYVHTNNTLYMGSVIVGNGYADRQMNTTVIPGNAWTHVALVKTSAGYTGYVNGVPGTLLALTGGLDYQSAQPVTMGALSSAGEYPFLGYISNSRIVKGTAVYTGAFTPPAAPLTAIANTSLLTLQNPVPANNRGFFDRSQNNAPFTPGGNPAQGAFTPYSQTGWSGSFNGTNQLITVASSSAAGPGTVFTVEGWAYPTGFVTSENLVMGSAVGSLQIGHNGTQFGLAATGQAWLLTGTTGLTLNQWNHFAVVRSGTGANQTSVYINGVRTANGTVSNALVTSSAITIGATSASQYQFPGYLSNIRIVSGTAVYDPSLATLTVPTSPLTAIAGTSLLTLQDNRFKDNSTNNLAITGTNSPGIVASSPFNPTASYSVATNGGSTYFNGTTDYIYAVNPSSAYSFGTGNFTLEFWVYPLSGPVSTYNPAFYTQNSTGGAAWSANGGFRIHHSNILFSDSTTLNYTSAITNNVWTHIALVRVGNTLTAYKNGVANGTKSHTIAIGSPLNQPALGISDTANAGGREFLNGYVSDMRIVNGTAIYTGAFTPPTAPLSPAAYANTTLLLSGSNAASADYAASNDLVPVGTAQVTSSITKFGTNSMSIPAGANYFKAPMTQNFNVGTGNFTIEGWIYRTSSAVLGRVAQFADGGSLWSGVNLYITTSNVLTLAMSASGSSWDIINGANAGTITNNTWTHFALVRNGTSMQVYLNGVGGQVGTIGASIIPYYNSSYFLTVGGASDGTGLAGYIDDFRFTKGVARYTSTFTPPSAAFPTR